MEGPSTTYPSSISSTVSIITNSSHTITGTAGANAIPIASALSLDGTILYVASYLGLSVSPISVATGGGAGFQLQVPFAPLSIVADPANNGFIYVGGADSIVVFDTTIPAIVQTFPFGAASLATFPPGSTGTPSVFASYQGSVYAINAVSRTLQQVISLQQPAGVTAGKIVASSNLSVFVQTINTTSGHPVPSPIVTFSSNGSAMQNIPVTQVIRDIAVSPNGKLLYATGDQQEILEWSTTTPQITLVGFFYAGKAPEHLVITGDGSTAYVSDATNSIETIDLATMTITSQIGVLGAVLSLTLTQDSSELFVSNNSSATNLVPTAGGQADTTFLYARFSGFSPFTSAVSPNAQFLWTSCKSRNGVLTNTAVFPPYSYFFEFAPSFAVFSPDSSTLYVTHSTGTTAQPQWAVTSLNSTSLAIGKTTKLPEGLTIVGKPVVTPNNQSLIVPAIGSTNSGVYILSIATNTVTGFVPLPGVKGVAVSPNGQTIYAVFNTPAPSVAVINLASQTITKTVAPPVTSNLDYIVVSPDGTRIYAGGPGTSSSQIFGANVADGGNSFFVTLPDNGLNGLALTTDGTQLFYSDSKSEYAISLDTQNGASVTSTFLFGYASDVVIAQ